jgi:hypothetical protein
MNAIRNIWQQEASAGIEADAYSASLTWASCGWEVWITAACPTAHGMGWGIVWEASIPWPWHFDQATRDEAATLLCNEVVRRFGNAWGAP